MIAHQLISAHAREDASIETRSLRGTRISAPQIGDRKPKEEKEKKKKKQTYLARHLSLKLVELLLPLTPLLIDHDHRLLLLLVLVVLPDVDGLRKKLIRLPTTSSSSSSSRRSLGTPRKPASSKLSREGDEHSGEGEEGGFCGAPFSLNLRYLRREKRDLVGEGTDSDVAVRGLAPIFSSSSLLAEERERLEGVDFLVMTADKARGGSFCRDCSSCGDVAGAPPP